MMTSQAATILITGATGNVGRELTEQLQAQNISFRVMVRSLKKIETFCSTPGIEFALGDFNDPETVADALKGIDRVFLLTNSSAQAETQQLKFVEQASRAGVKQIVKLSQYGARVDSPVRFLRYHAVVENRIKELGIPYTFVRPNLFVQCLRGFRRAIINQNRFFAPIGDAKVSIADVRDIATVAAAALTEDGHAEKIYNITGPEALSHQEMAEKLSDALHRHIEFVSIPPESMRIALAGVGFPDWQADGLIEEYAYYNRGEASTVTTDFQNVTGKQPRSFDQFARDYAVAFSSQVKTVF